MGNIFDSLRVYAGKWSVAESRNFTAEELNEISSAVVVESDYGNSVCFMMVNGGKTYIPLSQTSGKQPGETIDVRSAKLLRLEKSGEADIFRVEA